MTYPVSECFQSFQGEATHTGRPSVFIRFQGCPVGCPWCDTAGTWHLDPAKRITPEEMLAKTETGDTWAEMTDGQLLGIVKSFAARHVVLTGGEPCIHDLVPLTSEIMWSLGRTVQVETSGTYPIRVAHKTWVTVSPKMGMPGGRAVLPEALARADEIKFPIGKQTDLIKLREALDIRPPTSVPVPIWLQPLSHNKKATTLCLEAATENGWRLSVQTHGYVGVR